jgi:glycosyltransferase involved in cell wall biosynthesis
MYSGNMGMSQTLSQVLEAAELLQDRKDIVFAMVGDGADRRNLEQMAADKKLTNVRFFGYQPKAELATSLSAADAHVVILQPHIRQLLMPSKIYGVLASGTPVIALTADECELANIVREHDLGRVVSNVTSDAIANTVLNMADDRRQLAAQGARAREYAVQNCTRTASVSRMRELLNGLLGRANQQVAAPQAAMVTTTE